MREMLSLLVAPFVSCIYRCVPSGVGKGLIDPDPTTNYILLLSLLAIRRAFIYFYIQQREGEREGEIETVEYAHIIIQSTHWADTDTKYIGNNKAIAAYSRWWLVESVGGA